MQRLLIVDAERLVCQLVAEALATELIGIASEITHTAQDAEQRLAMHRFQYVLINTSLPNGDAFHLVQRIRKKHPATRVIVTGLPSSESITVAYLEAGAIGYVRCNEPLERLLSIIRAAGADEALLAPPVATAVMTRVAALSRRLQHVACGAADLDNLTPKEEEILQHLALGHTNREIAQQLTVEIGTVKNHVHNILTKLNVHNRREAALHYSIHQKKSLYAGEASGRLFDIQRRHFADDAPRRVGSE